MTPLKLNQTVYHFIHGWEGKVVELLPQEDAPCCIESGFFVVWGEEGGGWLFLSKFKPQGVE